MNGHSPSTRFRDFYNGKRVLVTGGAGFIGSHLVDELASLGARVKVLDNLSTGTRRNLASSFSRIQLIAGDVASKECLSRLGEIEVVFHDAALSLLQSFYAPISNCLTNVVGTLNILELVRKMDARMVFASTGSIYGSIPDYICNEETPRSPITLYFGPSAVKVVMPERPLGTVCEV